MEKQGNLNIRGAFHIAIIKEVDKTIERFWNDLGIGPWQIITIGSGSERMTLHGKPIFGKVRAAVTQVGPLMIAIDQPLSRPNPYEEILDQRGGGAHHLAWIVDRLDQATEEMERMGYKEICCASGIGPSGDGAGSYFETIENMGTVIELAQLPTGGMPPPEGFYPSPDKLAKVSKINIRGVVYAAIAVRDAGKAAGHYQKDLGIGPWQMVTFGAEVKKATYRKRTVSFAVKRALAQVGPMVVVLEQPLSGPSPLQDFLDRNGQGIQRVCLAVDPLDQAVEEMQRLGYEELGAVYGFGPKGEGEARCFDTEKNLGIMIELEKASSGV